MNCFQEKWGFVVLHFTPLTGKGLVLCGPEYFCPFPGGFQRGTQWLPRRPWYSKVRQAFDTLILILVSFVSSIFFCDSYRGRWTRSDQRFHSVSHSQDRVRPLCDDPWHGFLPNWKLNTLAGSTRYTNCNRLDILILKLSCPSSIHVSQNKSGKSIIFVE